MRKIIQIMTGMFTYIDQEQDFDEQKYSLFVLCDDSTIWQYMGENKWENIDTSQITNYIKPRTDK